MAGQTRFLPLHPTHRALSNTIQAGIQDRMIRKRQQEHLRDQAIMSGLVTTQRPTVEKGQSEPQPVFNIGKTPYYRAQPSIQEFSVGDHKGVLVRQPSGRVSFSFAPQGRLTFEQRKELAGVGGLTWEQRKELAGISKGLTFKQRKELKGIPTATTGTYTKAQQMDDTRAYYGFLRSALIDPDTKGVIQGKEQEYADLVKRLDKDVRLVQQGKTPTYLQDPLKPPKAIRRTGTLNGRKVVEYEDGTIEYAD